MQVGNYASLLVGEYVEVWGSGNDRKILTLGPLKTINSRIKVNSVNDGLSTELMAYPLSKDEDGNFWRCYCYVEKARKNP